MTRAVTRTWYRLALARAREAPVLVAASGEHLGAAVAAAERHVAGARAVAAEVARAGEVPLGESVGKHPVVTLGDAAPEDLPAFGWPIGVLPRLGRAEALRGAARGYALHPDERLLVIEAQTDREHLVDLFLGMIERLPAADNLEVRVLDHFEDAGRTDVWLTSRVDARRILRFLDDFDVELIDNGHLELSVYVRAHKATLRLTEHKTVVWLAEGRALEAEVRAHLRELGVPRSDRLVGIAGAPHFHYRPARSRDRKKLGEELYRQRLRRVDSAPAREREASR
jgi:hypothetical protein